MTRSRILGIAFLTWEAVWLHVYVTAPRPDQRMVTVAAELLAVWIPGILVMMAVGLKILWRIIFTR